MATTLVNGGFFIKRYRKLYENGVDHTPSEIAKKMQIRWWIRVN